jgi:Arc/MetJ-type ribon-helix-helix transcriptional regulator
MAETAGTKAMTLRLSNWHYAVVKSIAAARGVSASDVIREAIGDHIEKRRADPAFQRRLQEIIEENNATLERLVNDA